MPNDLLDTTIKMLLQKVVETHGYKIVHSKDCDNLAYNISEVCGESISGSTLKRLFGFIKSTSQPNKFTLNLLSRYIGHDDFNDFKSKYQLNSSVEIKNSVSEFLEVNKLPEINYCDFTKGQKKIAEFLNSKFQLTSIIGEEGSGRTTFLTHFLSQSDLQKVTVIFSVSAKQILNQICQINDSTQLLIIDGLEESVYNFKDIRQCFIELLKITKQYNKLRVIIALTPYTWVRLTEIVIKNGDSNKWYNVDINATNPSSAKNIDDFVSINIDPNFPFRSPLMFQLSKNLKSSEVTNSWVILTSFFKRTVWDTAYAFEKQQFFNSILQSSNYGQELVQIDRTILEPLIVKYKKAHLDLVSVNIICEQKELNKFGAFKSRYSFGKSIYGNYLILSKLLNDSKGFNSNLLEEISSKYSGERKLELLKLATSFALSEIDANAFIVFDLDLSEYERQALMIELGHQVRENKLLQEQIVLELPKLANTRKYFIERWIDEEHLNGFYGVLIKSYLKYVSSNQDVIFGNALLYYNAYLKDDAKECALYYSKIVKISDDKERIHPYVLGRKYMTLLIEEFRKTKSYSKQTIQVIQKYLSIELRETNTDLPVHSFGFEHNILHAEFLTRHYHFTPFILEKLKDIESIQLHKKDVDHLLFQIFKTAYFISLGENLMLPCFNLNNVHPWYKYTVEMYLERLKS